MPYYVIAHADPLTVQERDALAATITEIHTTLFTTPSLFVNVKFENVSAASYYVGGRRAQVNTVHANVRTGKSRPRSAYDELCRKIRAAWEELLTTNTPLHAVFIHGSLVAGEEQGFLRPEAGHDADWVRMNLPEFEKRAAAGNKGMKLLVDECKARGLGNSRL